MATTPRNQPGTPEVDKDQHAQPKPNDEIIPQTADDSGEDDGEGNPPPTGGPGGNNPPPPDKP